MSQQITYEAAVYTRTVSYKNLKGVERTLELHFALDPLQLLRLVADVPTPKRSKSANPARRAEQEATISDEQQLKFLVDLANRAAGFPSDDGESWEPFEDFGDTLAGKAFITKLASSDGDRLEFAEKVVIAPFEAFINYAEADEGNTAEEIKQFREMLESMRRIFAVASDKEMSVADRKAKLAREMAELEAAEGNEA